jgi:heme oxygenase (biliverdin-IX-beta and delta-forming)
MILQRLREETRAAHEAIERDLDALGAHASVERYRVLVTRFFGFYAVWEPQIGTALGDEDFFAPRRKTHLLEQDLGVLGYDRSAIQALPRCRDLPPFPGLPETLGSLYVLEGSTLGGQVIARRLERSLGFADGRGYAFFRSYGREVGAMWRALGARLLALPLPAGEAAVGSAQLTFARLHSWLCRGDSS